ncbi:hypothetical protein H8Z72_23380 (plasmid) [Xanthomonas citri pv. citri]|nr:hypothetical protein [Xanthomonas citri]QRD62743.1 hypothetical protein H8Z74_22805 [Xanthomonas citri pv. citri]QRD67070.1 hypothetical protein H8Z73_22890 [Xanthomonas citri pv. citri]QRD71677.1 hypothetical protein H8Z72_23380 [Xanthomonas citri pv. citri]
MQNLFVGDAFHRWLPTFIRNPRSPARSTALRVFDALIDPVCGKTPCRAVSPASVRLALDLRGQTLGTDAAGHAQHLLSLMMESHQLWPRTVTPSDPFSVRSPLDVPLSPLDVADHVCRVPTNYRMMVHMLLLTGIRPQQLVHLRKAEFVAMLGRMDGREDRSLEVFEVHLSGSHLPIYLTVPIISKLRSHVSRLGELDDRVFSTTAAAITHAWGRYAGGAPALNRYKGTAGTHLLRHGGDAHVLSANLGINLSSAEAMMERLSPFAAHQETLAIA